MIDPDVGRSLGSRLAGMTEKGLRPMVDGSMGKVSDTDVLGHGESPRGDR